MGSWSLCTEEQLYLVTPLVLIVSASYVRTLSAYRTWLWAVLVAVVLFRSALWVHVTRHFFNHDPRAFVPIYYNFHTHCDGLIIGLIISNLWVSRDQISKFRVRPGILVGVGFFLLVILRQLQHEIFGFAGLAFFFGSLVEFGLQQPLRTSIVVRPFSTGDRGCLSECILTTNTSRHG